MHLQRIAELLAPFLATPVSELQLSQLASYLEILHRWNARMNLTAVRDPEQVVTRHFGESLFAAQVLFPQSGAPPSMGLIDIGSGAGFPGLPIKIWAPALDATLVESQNKKATFLKEVIRALELKDITVANTRAEDLPSPSNATVTLRAVEKFERVLPTAVRIARGGRLALLIGASQVGTAIACATQLRWCEAVPIPLSNTRVLLIGESA